MSSRRGWRAKRIMKLFGMVDDGLIYHRVSAGEPKAPIGRGQKQLPLPP